MNDSSSNIAVGFSSNSHEFGVWDLKNSSEQINPLFYFLSTPESNPVLDVPYLLNLEKKEDFSNYALDFSDYDPYLPLSESFLYKNFLSYFTDPLFQHQQKGKQRWLANSKISYCNIGSYFKYKNFINKIICLSPPKGVSSYVLSGQYDRSLILTAGSDKNIRLWSVRDEKASKKSWKSQLVCNVDNNERDYSSFNAGNIEVNVEYIRQEEKKPDSKEKDKKPPLLVPDFHKDNIQDMIFLDRPKGSLIVTGSRDNTIKIWK